MARPSDAGTSAARKRSRRGTSGNRGNTIRKAGSKTAGSKAGRKTAGKKTAGSKKKKRKNGATLILRGL